MKTRSAASFTLFEVVVGIFLSALIMISAAGLWISSVRAWRTSETRQAQDEDEMIVERRLQEIFSRALLEPSNPDYFSWKTRHGSDGRFASDDVELCTEWPTPVAEGRLLPVPVRGKLWLETTAAHAGEPAGKKLMWSYSPFTADEATGTDADRIVLSTEVEGLGLKYWSKGSTFWSDEWRQEKKWPEAVEVEVDFRASPGRPARILKFSVALPPPLPEVVQGPATTGVPAPENQVPTPAPAENPSRGFIRPRSSSPEETAP
ncbi:MAG: hypothetical protein JO317_03130 [Verrucomicrobiae bacterium]|nr:hypothetical protein [Verrucomicrobiae bacterium]